MRFRLLGPLQVWDGAGWSSIRAAQPRVVLSVLLIEAGRPVTTDRLVAELWHDRPPRAAAAVVRGYIVRLRRLLGSDTRGPLATVGAGYRLDIGGDDLDARQFDRLVTVARDAMTNGQPRAAAARLAAALALWRGDALADVPPTPTVTTYVTQLEDARLTAVEAYVDAQIDLGHHRDVIAKLRRLTVQHPLRERLWAQLMLALHRSERRGEALDAFRRARAVLADELGIEPGHHLRELHRAILTEDDPTSPQRPAVALAPRRALPVDHPGFTGRHADLARLSVQLHAATAGTATPLVLITGPAGVGKTTLAVHWAHQVAEHFPDGQLYLDLRGFGPDGTAMQPIDAIHSLLDMLGVAPQRVPTGLEAQVALYRSLLFGRRMLIVLDNARDSAQVSPLLPGTPDCLSLITSRHQLTGLIAAGACPIALDLFSPAEAVQMLAERLGADRVSAEPLAVEELIARCARLPLALAIIAARAAIHPTFPLDALAAELRDTHSRLDLLTGGDATTDLRTVFSWSYDTLSAPAARLFRLLGLHPGPDLPAPAAASLAGVPTNAVRPLLGELTRAHLITEPTPGRHAMHDLLRDYAADQGRRADGPTDRTAAVMRLHDHYLHTAHAAARLLDPGRDPITIPTAAPRTVLQRPAAHVDAMAWFTAEHANLLAVSEHADPSTAATWHLAWAMLPFLDRGGHWHDLATIQRRAITAAHRAGDPQASINAHRYLARAYSRLGRLDDAETELHRALALSAQSADPTAQGHIHLNVSLLWQLRGRYADALHHARRALHLLRAAGCRHGRARSLNAVGAYHALLGNYRAALNHCQRAFVAFRGLTDLNGQANTFDSLGYIHHHLGHHRRALACLRQAIHRYRGVGDRHLEALTLAQLGDTHRAAGQPRAARHAWLRAVDILTQLDHRDVERVAARLLDPDTAAPHPTARRRAYQRRRRGRRRHTSTAGERRAR